MISKNRYKFSYVFLYLFILIILNSPSETSAQTFFSEDWDTGTPPSGWPCKDAPNYLLCNAVQNTPFNGWYTNGYCDYAELSSVGLSTTRAHSGTRAFYQLRATGQYAGCDIIHDISPPYPTKLHLRFYLFLDSNYINYNTPTSREPMGHFLFTNIALSGAGFRINLLSKVPYIQDHVCASGKGGIPSNQPYMFFNCGNNTEHCTVGAPSPCYNLLEHLNEWQCVEFMFDATNKKYNIWINGTKYVDNVTVPMTQNNFTMVQFSPWVSDDISFNTSYYLDDIVAADSYIGCNGGGDGGGTPPPSSGGGGDSGGGSGGSGCGFVKDENGKGQEAKGEGLSLIIMLVLTLAGIALFKRRLSNIRLDKKERADI